MEDLLSSIYQAILEGDQAAARAAVQRALEENLEAETILKQAMIPAMQEVRAFVWKRGNTLYRRWLVGCPAPCRPA